MAVAAGVAGPQRTRAPAERRQRARTGRRRGLRLRRRRFASAVSRSTGGEAPARRSCLRHRGRDGNGSELIGFPSQIQTHAHIYE